MYKLIIADDEALVRAGLYYWNDWNAIGFEVVALLEDGSDVLKFLEEQRADVVLADISMYQVTGLEVANVVREKYPWMKVVLLSGYQEFEYAREAVRCRVYEYLLKPIDYDELNSVFREIKKELDMFKQEELLMGNLDKMEYMRILEVAQMVVSAVLGESEEKWIAYAYLRTIMNNTSPENRKLVGGKIFELLLEKVHEIAPKIALDLEYKINDVRASYFHDADDKKDLIEILSWINDEITIHVQGAGSKCERDDSMVKACKWIKNHLGEEFTYQDVANFVHLSPRHFIRRFQKEVGETFSDYVYHLRMETAKKLAEDKVINLDDVGLLVGYRDGKYFKQLFKSYTGYSIKEYRNGVMNNETKN